jgi:molybdate transport system permease protein
VRRRTGVPYPLLAPAAIGTAFLLLPLVGLLVRAPWRNLPGLISRPEVRTALRLSLETATAATTIAILLGVPIAWVLARLQFRGRNVLRALITVPLVLPPVAGGIALLLAYGRRGVVGGWLLKDFGISLPFTTAAVVIAETFVAMPFLIVSVEGALRGLDVRYDQAVASLGASRWFTFRHVTLPMLVPGIVAGAVLCWARALGEFGATITFVSNIPGETQTLSAAIYTYTNVPGGDAAAGRLVLVAIAIALAALIASEWFARRAGMRFHGE